MLTSKFVMIFFLMSFIIMPIFVLLHELGHAIPILFRTEQMVHIELGKSIGRKKCFVIKQSRLRISIHPFIFIYGACVVEDWEKVKKKEAILCYSGGPIATLLSLITVVVISSFEISLMIYNICIAATIFLSIQLIVTCIPVKYPSWVGGRYGENYSDGYKIIRLVQLKGSDEN